MGSTGVIENMSSMYNGRNKSRISNIESCLTKSSRPLFIAWSESKGVIIQGITKNESLLSVGLFGSLLNQTKHVEAHIQRLSDEGSIPSTSTILKYSQCVAIDQGKWGRNPPLIL